MENNLPDSDVETEPGHRGAKKSANTPSRRESKQRSTEKRMEETTLLLLLPPPLTQRTSYRATGHSPLSCLITSMASCPTLHSSPPFPSTLATSLWDLISLVHMRETTDQWAYGRRRLCKGAGEAEIGGENGTSCNWGGGRGTWQSMRQYV